jgi:hypothetical protein
MLLARRRCFVGLPQYEDSKIAKAARSVDIDPEPGNVYGSMPRDRAYSGSAAGNGDRYDCLTSL